MNILNILSRFETYENIRDRMLSRIPDDVDKSQTSFTYNILTNIAMELYQIHFQLQTTLNSQFVDTAEGVYLSQLCKERGCPRLHDRPMIIEAEIYTSPNEVIINLPIGTLYRNGTHTFKITDFESPYYILESLDRKPINLTPEWSAVSYTKFHRLEVKKIIQEGAYEETDEELRLRFSDTVDNYPFGGNIGDYQFKIKTMFPELTQVRVVPHQEGWVGREIEIYLLKQGQPLTKDELLKYDEKLSHLPTIGHRVLFKTPQLDTTTVLRIEVLVPLNTDKVEVESQMRYHIAKYSESLRTTFDKDIKSVIQSTPFSSYLMEKIPYIVNVSSLTFNNLTTVEFNYDTLPSFSDNLISITIREV